MIVKVHIYLHIYISMPGSDVFRASDEDYWDSQGGLARDATSDSITKYLNNHPATSRSVHI